MTNATTQHIKALLIDDGREFAMIRKTDLAALMQIAETDPHQGRYLDPIGAHKAEIGRLTRESNALRKIRFNQMRDALKHGEERRRYMANNKALQARNDGLQESLLVTRQAQLWADHYLAIAEGKLRRISSFKRKFPAIGALMDVTP